MSQGRKSTPIIVHTGDTQHDLPPYELSLQPSKWRNGAELQLIDPLTNKRAHTVLAIYPTKVELFPLPASDPRINIPLDDDGHANIELVGGDVPTE